MDRGARRLAETVLLLTVLARLTGSYNGGPPSYACPQYCLCERRTRSVSCRGNLFPSVPPDLPRDTRTLQLRGQNFTVLARLGPGPLRSLRELDLAQSGLRYLADDALAGLPRLKRLDLSYNRLERVPTAVSRAGSLKELVMHHNLLGALRPGDFANLTRLRLLDLDNNRLERLPFGVFSPLRELSVLYLSNNSIASLSAEMFGNLSRLEELHLTHNRIQTVGHGWLGSVPNVWVLQLGYALAPGRPAAAANLLRTTGDHGGGPGRQLWLPNLEHLVARGNNLTTLPCRDLAGFPALKFLDLSFNSLRTVPRACFSRLWHLGALQLSNNAIVTLEREAFRNAYSVWMLDLSANLLRELPPRAFLGTRLDHLDLSFNQLRGLGNRTFVGLEYLPFLALSGNRLERLPRSALRPLRSLDILDLRWNYLTRVAGQFSNMSRLTNLALSGNLIEHLSPDAFRGSLNLKGLFLDGNRLRTVSEETFVDLPRLVHVKLYNNPWHCDCGMKWIREAMVAETSRHPWMLYTDVDGVDSYKGIVCASPLAFANVSVFMIKETDIFRLICTTYVSPLAIEFIVGISFGIIASSTLCYVAKLYCKVRDLERSGAEAAKCLS